MIACACFRTNGQRCSREVSRVPGLNPLFCWQHQHCVSHLTESEREARMACEKSARQSFEKTGKIVKQDDLAEFFKTYDLPTDFEMKLRVEIDQPGKINQSKITNRTYHGLDALRMAGIDLPTLLNIDEQQYVDMFEQYLTAKELLDLWGAIEVEREQRGLVGPDQQPVVEGGEMLTVQQFFKKYLPDEGELANELDESGIDMSMLLHTTPDVIRKGLIELSFGDQIRLWSGLVLERNRLGIPEIDEEEINEENPVMLTLEDFIEKYLPGDQDKELIKQWTTSGITMPKLLELKVDDLQKKPFNLITRQLFRIWYGIRSERHRLGLD